MPLPRFLKKFIPHRLLSNRQEEYTHLKDKKVDANAIVKEAAAIEARKQEVMLKKRAEEEKQAPSFGGFDSTLAPHPGNQPQPALPTQRKTNANAIKKYSFPENSANSDFSLSGDTSSYDTTSLGSNLSTCSQSSHAYGSQYPRRDTSRNWQEQVTHGFRTVKKLTKPTIEKDENEWNKIEALLSGTLRPKYTHRVNIDEKEVLNWLLTPEKQPTSGAASPLTGSKSCSSKLKKGTGFYWHPAEPTSCASGIASFSMTVVKQGENKLPEDFISAATGYFL